MLTQSLTEKNLPDLLVKRVNRVETLMCKVMVLVLFVLTIFSLLLLPLPVYSNQIYSIAIVPQLPKPITHKNWAPLIHQLTEITGLNFELKTYDTFRDFENSILQGEPDFAYMNPYHQVMVYDAQGYIPLVRDDATKLSGIIVVRKDSPIRSLEDLKGKTIAFPSPIAFAASLYMRAMLSREHIDFDAEYVLTHTNVYRNVILGMVAAGGGVNKTLDHERIEVKDQLRILYTLPGVESHPVSAHPRVTTAVQLAVTDAILNLVNTNVGQQILKSVHINRPVKANYEHDYKPLSVLGLEKFVRQNSVLAK